MRDSRAAVERSIGMRLAMPPLLLLALACAKGPSTAQTPAASLAPSAPSASAVASAPVAAAAPAIAKLPDPPPVARGAIKVVGYPTNVSTGMNDPAHLVGFTSDDSEYGYCMTLEAREPGLTKCETILRDGTTQKRSSDDAKGFSPASFRALSAWMKSSGMAHIKETPDMNWPAPPLAGTWDYSDVTVHVSPIAGDGNTPGGGVLQVGGAVDGEAPVFPVRLTPTDKLAYHTTIANDLALSSDGKELGIVAHFFCMEWCDDFRVARMTTASFASLVYNDTGFRHHKKGEYARAAELFLKAAAADPSAKLPAYNLACAWARISDPRVSDALAVAIARDPAAKERARKDEDFASVRDAAWFQAAVR